METYKNIKSGKYFICVNDSGEDEIQLTTPNGDIRFLKRRLFQEGPGGEGEVLLSQKLITDVQLKKYQWFEASTKNETLDKLILFFEELYPETGGLEELIGTLNSLASKNELARPTPMEEK